MTDAEQHARAVMQGADPRWPPFADPEGAYRWWCETFGASEVEFEEMADGLVRRYRRTPFWRFRQRRLIVADYVKVQGLLTAANGFYDGVAMSERRCACGCPESMEGMRADAIYASAACRTRAWKRREGITGIRYTKASQNGKSKPSGLQVSYRKATDAAAALAMRIVEQNARALDVQLPPGARASVHLLAEFYMSRALSSRARETLQQRQEMT